MKTTDRVAVMVGLDVHRRFSTVTGRDAEGKIAWRQRLQHEDRRLFRQRLEGWPRGIPVILESSFGWEWVCEELEQAGLEPCLASSRKVAAWRNARGIAKSNRTDSDLLSELGGQTDRWWQVWLPPREVRDRREWLRYPSFYLLLKEYDHRPNSLDNFRKANVHPVGTQHNMFSRTVDENAARSIPFDLASAER